LEGAGEEAGRKCDSKEVKKRAAFEWGHRSLLKGMRVSIDLKGLVAGEISETVQASLECPTLAASRRRWNTGLVNFIENRLLVGVRISRLEEAEMVTWNMGG
jgi:hypothetical protein